MNILLDEYSNREMNVISCTMNGFHHFKGMILNLRIHSDWGGKGHIWLPIRVILFLHSQ